ncbi:hypothetical protein IFM89_023312, partial [Coptis chinensis]
MKSPVNAQPVKAQPVKSTPVKAHPLPPTPKKKSVQVSESVRRSPRFTPTTSIPPPSPIPPPSAYTVKDVVDDWEHVLGSLDLETFDEVALGETFTDDDGDALDDREIRSDDEGDKMYEYGYSFGPVFGTVINNDEWSAEDEDEEDYNYNISDSDYLVCGTDDEALNDMEPMVLEEELQNLEEELQGSDLPNVVRVNTNIYETEEMAKLAGPKVENVLVCDFKPKMCWPTVEACRDFFRNLAIRKKFSFRHLKNHKERLILECKDLNCQWKVIATVTKRDNHTFILRKFLNQHTCEADDENKYAQATSPWVAKTLVHKIRDHPDYKPWDIQKEIFYEFGVSISYWTAWRMLSMESFEHGVVPNVLYMIKNREERYNNYEIKGVIETHYLAMSHLTGKKYNVEIQKLECSCIEWQMSGVPCVHAVAVLRSRREPWSRYYSPYFNAKAFKATYVGYLYPLDNIEDWPEI